MSRPGAQRVSIIALAGQPEDLEARFYAVEVSLGFGGVAPSDDLVDAALALVAPHYWVLDETRHQTNWGATGLQAQDVMVLYSIAVGAQLTATAIGAGLAHVAGGVFHGNPRNDAQAAWIAFEVTLLRCFKVGGAEADEITEDGEAWNIRGHAGNRAFEGRVTKDGRVVEVRRSDRA